MARDIHFTWILPSYRTRLVHYVTRSPYAAKALTQFPYHCTIRCHTVKSSLKYTNFSFLWYFCLRFCISDFRLTTFATPLQYSAAVIDSMLSYLFDQLLFPPYFPISTSQHPAHHYPFPSSWMCMKSILHQDRGHRNYQHVLHSKKI